MKKAKGFTLIELLVVIAIIGLLSTLAVIALGTARAKARDAKRVSDIKQVQSALELYNSDAGGYPVGTTLTLGSTTDTITTALCDTKGFSDNTATNCSATGAVTYMGQVPANPTPNGADYKYSSLMSDGGDCAGAPCPSYIITFKLEGKTGGLPGGTTLTASPEGIK